MLGNSSFYRSILLPSNGLEYSQFAQIKKLPVGAAAALEDTFLAGSQTELFASIFSCILKNIPAEELFWADAFYLWTLVFSEAFKINNFTMLQSCDKCGKNNSIKVPFEKISVLFNTNKEKFLKYHISGEGLQKNIFVVYERRKLKHNFISGLETTGAELNNSKHTKEIILAFIKPQIKFIQIGKEKILKADEIVDLLDNLKLKQIKDIFKVLPKSDFGAQENLSFSCTECEKINRFEFNNPLVSAIYNSEFVNEQEYFKNFKTLLETGFYFNKFGLMKFDSFLELPMSEVQTIMQVAKETLERANGSNKGGGLTPEEFFGIAPPVE